MNRAIKCSLVIIFFLIILSGLTACNQTTAVSTSILKTYSESEFNLLKGKHPVTFFFHADWCGTCKILETQLNENSDQIPKEVTIFKVDFDKETELKKEYGILMQSMFVVFDKDGNVVEKLAAPTFEELIESLKKSV